MLRLAVLLTVFFSAAALLTVFLSALASCGSGIVTGILGSKSGDSAGPPEVRAPSLQVNPATAPFARLEGNTLINIIIKDARLGEEHDPTKFDSDERAEFARRSKALQQNPKLKWFFPAQNSPDDARVFLRSREFDDDVTRFYANTGFEDYRGERGAPQHVLLTIVEGNDTRLIVSLDTVPFALAVFKGNNGKLKDLKLELSLRMAGGSIGKAPIEFTILAPPIYRLSNPGNLPARVSVDGSSTLRFEVSNLVEDNPSLLKAYILQRDYSKSVKLRSAFNWIEAQATNTNGLSKDSSGKFRGSFVITVPSARFPGLASLAIEGDGSGSSVLDSVSLLYEPKLARQGLRAGDVSGQESQPWFLLGSGLIPAKEPVSKGKIELDLANVELRFSKGGKTTRIDGIDFKEGTDASHIFFEFPPSPDGLPGSARLTLFQRLTAGKTAHTVEKEFFGGVVYSVTNPVLGPWVIPLPEQGLEIKRDLVAGRFLSENSLRPDLTLLSAVVGNLRVVGELRLLRNFGFAVYRPMVKAEKTLLKDQDLLNPFQLSPFRDGRVGGSVLDNLYITGGTGVAQIGLVKATNNIASPFSYTGLLEKNRFAQRIVDSASARLNGDKTEDLLVLAQESSVATQATEPELYVFLSQANGAWQRRKVATAVSVQGTALHVSDLDGDFAVDVAVASPAMLELHVLHGDGLGRFLRTDIFSFKDENLDLGSSVEIIGLFSMASPSQAGRHLAIVAKGSKAAAVFPLLRSQGKYVRGISFEIDFQGLDLMSSTAMDIDGSTFEEVILGLKGTTGLGCLKALRFDESSKQFKLAPALIEDPSLGEPSLLLPVRLTEALSLDTPGDGLLVLHKEILDSKLQQLVSVLPRKRSGLASRRPKLTLQAEPSKSVIGDFDLGDARIANDCFTMTPITNSNDFKLELHRNLGPANYAKPLEAHVHAAIPGSLVRAPWKLDGDLVAWLTTDKKLFVRTPLPSGGSRIHTADLNQIINSQVPASWPALSVLSKILVADGDKDGSDDLILCLVKPDENGIQTILAFLPALAQPGRDKLPFAVSANGDGVTGIPLFRAFDAIAGDLKPHSATNSPGTEIALRMEPGAGVFTFFYSLEKVKKPKESYKFSPIKGSSIQAILDLRTDAAKIMFADLREGDSSAGPKKNDLIVLTENKELHIYLHPDRKVNSAKGFELDRQKPSPLGALDATGLAFVDMSGDGLKDILVVGRGLSSRPLICVYLNLGGGVFTKTAHVYANLLLGDDSLSFAVLDMDGNGMQDLLLGRNCLLSR